DPDPTHLLDSLRSLLERRGDESDTGDGGFLTAVASPEQRRALDGIAGLMSLLEGHGDVTMDRAGRGIVVGVDRFGRVLRQRRRSASGFTRIFQKLVGLEAKLAQYAKGEAFIEEVEDAGGTTLVNRVWEAPSNLPDLAEINSPSLWIARMGVVG
ncbi:MAG: zinc-dependent metalloprotease, partial [Acidimicrobiales bacterium]|nr:zinc-dependent metalloprotease [Acidimicrobiales bacterium]